MRPRPSHHLTAATGWLNDPNGPVWHAGRHHLFFQHNPDAPVWGPPRWAHASSPDLVTWTRHPPALRPEGVGPDADGIWSGCARVVDGRLALFYTGVVGDPEAGGVESVCRADRTPDGGWARAADNPLVAGPPPGIAVRGHRDPFLVQERAGWGLLLGTGLDPGTAHARGAVLRHTSPDLLDWAYDGVLFSGAGAVGTVATGVLWECPQLLHVDGTDVLVVSVQDPDHHRLLRHAVWFTGAVVDGRFTARASGLLDHGDCYYAPAAYVDAEGRHLVWGWLQERWQEPPPGTDHAGALSLPRELDVVDGRVVVRPAIDVLALGDTVVDRTDVVLEAPLALDGHGAHLALRLVLGPDTVVVELARGVRRVTLTLDAPAGHATLDPGRDARPPTEVLTMPLHAAREVLVDVDATVLEVFAGGAALATRLDDDMVPPTVRLLPGAGAAAARLPRCTVVRVPGDGFVPAVSSDDPVPAR